MEADLTCNFSYEALPSNYGLGRNMLAGAFAGIAVSSARRDGRGPRHWLERAFWLIGLFRNTL